MDGGEKLRGAQEVSLIFICLCVKEVWRPFCFICFQPLLCCSSPSLQYLSCFGFVCRFDWISLRLCQFRLSDSIKVLVWRIRFIGPVWMTWIRWWTWSLGRGRLVGVRVVVRVRLVIITDTAFLTTRVNLFIIHVRAERLPNLSQPKAKSVLSNKNAYLHAKY